MEQRSFQRDDGQLVVVIAPVGKLDISTAWQFRLKLRECVTHLSPHVVLNLGKLDAIDSAGLTTLVAGLREAEKAEGSFRICNLSVTLRSIFEISTMDDLFEIYDNEAAALTLNQES